MSETQKLIIVGDGNTGKTALANCLKDEKSQRVVTDETGVVIHSDVSIGDVNFSMWDIDYNEKINYETTHAIVMYDVTSKVSLKRSLYLLNKIRDDNPDAVIILCGNKVDMGNNRVVPEENMEQQGVRYGARHISISAKEGTNISELKEMIVEFEY